MTLEEKINQAISSWAKQYPIESITPDRGFGSLNLRGNYLYYTNKYWVEATMEQLKQRGAMSDALTIIYRLIREAELSECLASPSALVRDYRTWWDSAKAKEKETSSLEEEVGFCFCEGINLPSVVSEYICSPNFPPNEPSPASHWNLHKNYALGRCPERLKIIDEIIVRRQQEALTSPSVYIRTRIAELL